VDLQLYFRVLSRFRVVVIAGVLLAAALAFFSMARVSLDGSPRVSWRSSEEWLSSSTLLITQRKFPEGRSVFEQQIPPVSTSKSQQYSQQFADPSRFIELTNLYSELVTSDPVRQIMLRQGPIRGKVLAVPAVSVNGAAALPLLSIEGVADTPAGAQALAARATGAFRRYLEAEQTAVQTPDEQRVLLQNVNEPVKATLLKGRSKTLPIVIFLAVLVATCGLAFALENLRPRVRQVSPDARRPSEATPVRQRA